MSKIKNKEINIPCGCTGGHKTCGFLRVIDMGFGEFEFCWVKRLSIKKPKKGVYLYGKDLEKLRRFIT